MDQPQRMFGIKTLVHILEVKNVDTKPESSHQFYVGVHRTPSVSSEKALRENFKCGLKEGVGAEHENF